MQNNRIFPDAPGPPDPFIGREVLLRELVRDLVSGKTSAAVGPHGIGKTALAAALAHSADLRAAYPDGVLRVELGKHADPRFHLNTWGTELGGDVSGYNRLSYRTEAVRELIGDKRFLVIIDGARRFKTARSMKVGGANCVHFLTTHNSKIALRFAGGGARTLLPLAPAPAADLLRALAPHANADRDSFQELASECAGSPLALRIAGNFLNTFAEKQIGAADFTAHLRRVSAESAPVRVLLAALELLESQPGGAGLVSALCALAAFAPDPAHFSRAAALATADASAEDLAQLVRLGLLDAQGDRLKIHTVIVKTVQNRLPPEALARHFSYYDSLVTGDPEDRDAILAEWPQIRQAGMHSAEDARLVNLTLALHPFLNAEKLRHEEIRWLKRALRAAPNHPQRIPTTVKLLNRAGEANRYLVRLKRAKEMFKKALNLLNETGETTWKGRTISSLGEIYIMLDNGKKGLKLSKKALKYLDHPDDRLQRAHTLNNIGLTYLMDRKFDEAHDYLNRALDLYRELSTPYVGIATANLGFYFSQTDSSEKALAHFRNAEEIARQSGDLEMLAASLSGIGTVQTRLQQYQEAASSFSRSLKMWDAIGNGVGLSYLFEYLSYIHRQAGQPEDTLHYENRLLKYHQAKGNLRETVTAYNRIGTALLEFNRPGEGLKQFQEALRLARKMDDPEQTAKTLGNLAFAYQEIGSYEEALRFTLLALEAHDRTGNKDRFASILNLGAQLLNHLQRPEQALGFLQQAASIRKELGEAADQTLALVDLAIQYRDLDRFEEAEAALQEALKLWQPGDDPARAVRILTELGRTHLLNEQPVKSLEYFNGAYLLSEKMGDPSRMAFLLSQTGSIHANLNQPQEAIEHYLAARSRIQEYGSPSDEAFILRKLAEQYSKTGKLVEAKKALMRAAAFYEQSSAEIFEEIQEQIAGIEIEIAEANREADWPDWANWDHPGNKGRKIH